MKHIHILLVEDNEGDIMLISEALLESRITGKVSVARDGVEAIDLLGEADLPAHSARPDLILLDINLPKKNGYEVLQHIKQDHSLRRIPVIMLTTSSSDKDVALSQRHRADSFMTKPLEASQLSQVVAGIEGFWTQFTQTDSGNHPLC